LSQPPLCGIDEAGRGPWAGSVVAAAVILPAGGIAGLADSKALTARRREALAMQIRAEARFGIGAATPAEIDAHNIRQATHLAMRRAVAALIGHGAVPAMRILVDGNDAPDIGLAGVAVSTLVSGDALEPAISAASILAKTTRDADMAAADAQFPGYGFSAHKGYGTAAHAEALARLGPCPIHRMSFKPVRAAAEVRSRG
jgi:ribonuclease HII